MKEVATNFEILYFRKHADWDPIGGEKTIHSKYFKVSGWLQSRYSS